MNTGVDVHNNTEMAESGDYTEIFSNVSTEAECVIASFTGPFQCYASTFDSATESCDVECSTLPNIPDNVTLVESSSNKTVLLRTANRGNVI